MISWTSSVEPVRLVLHPAGEAARPPRGRRRRPATASASSASAPTGVFSSWLTLATKSRRTASTRRASVRSSTRARARRRELSGATRARHRAAPRPRGWARQLEVGLADLAVAAHLADELGELLHGHPVAMDDPHRDRSDDALSTAPLASTTNAAPGSTDRIRVSPSGSTPDDPSSGAFRSRPGGRGRRLCHPLGVPERGDAQGAGQQPQPTRERRGQLHVHIAHDKADPRRRRHVEHPERSLVAACSSGAPDVHPAVDARSPGSACCRVPFVACARP